MVLDVPLSFFFVAAIILLGFITARIFQVTRIPDIPILLSVGLIVGPLNRFATERGAGSESLARLVEGAELDGLAPFISSLALIVILFDSGLKLDFLHFGRSIRPAFAHTLPLFLLTVLLISSIAHWVLGMPTLLAVVLGIALSNVGQTVSAALIREIDLDPETRSIYFVEMAIYDLISIPLLVAFLEFAQGGAAVDPSLFAQSLARVISVSVLLGLGSGLIWIYVLLRLESYPYSYMVTLAILLLVFSVNSFLGGSGPVSVLIFGLVVGNRALVLRMIHKPKLKILEGEKVHSFHDEITFFVRSFFFVFLGLTFTASVSGVANAWPVKSLLPMLDIRNPAGLFLLGVGLIFLAILVARYVVVRFVSARHVPERLGLFQVFARGLGTAVLATFPFTLESFREGTAYYDFLNPWKAVVLNTALLIILLTVTATALTVWARESRMRQAAARGSPGNVTAAKE